MLTNPGATKFFPIIIDATEIVDKAKEVFENGVEINL